VLLFTDSAEHTCEQILLKLLPSVCNFSIFLCCIFRSACW